jgi:hypothetical protein
MDKILSVDQHTLRLFKVMESLREIIAVRTTDNPGKKDLANCPPIRSVHPVTITKRAHGLKHVIGCLI